MARRRRVLAAVLVLFVLAGTGCSTRLIAHSGRPFMRPTTELARERQVPKGFIQGLAALDEQWFLYYGIDDSGIGVATRPR